MYLIVCDAANAVKIGIARNIDKRLAGLQVGNPFELRLAAHTLSGRPDRDELLLHSHFAKHRMRGEWFARDPVLDEILPIFQEHRLAAYTAALEPVRIVGRPQLRLPMSLARQDWKAKFSEMRRARMKTDRKQRL